jgi:Ca2+-transporting ATPase
LPLFLGWIYPNIFTPVHVIFLELIMGPTCSIVYENEPIEKNAMQQKPRKMTETFLNWRELSISIIQGLMITVGVLFAYQLAVQNGAMKKNKSDGFHHTHLCQCVFKSYQPFFYL